MGLRRDAMTFDEIITLTLNRCGARAASVTLQEAALAELGLIQTRLEEAPEVPWFLLTEQTSTTLGLGEPRIPLPENFLLEEEEAHLWIQNDGIWKPLFKEEYDLIQATYSETEPALPKNYAIRGLYFFLGPTPDDTYPLRMTYYKSQDVPALGIENRWAKYAPDVLIAELGKVMSGQYLSDYKKAASFERDIAIAQGRMLTKQIARDEINKAAQIRGTS